MKTLFELFIEDNQNTMYEGLNIDMVHHTISLTDEHDKGIDFSLVNNPVVYKLNGIDVISIFKITPLKSHEIEVDGNPFIYALKGEKGWKFDISEADAFKYMRRFLDVCHKINNLYDTIISVPTQSWLNARFMNVIANQVGAKYKISDYFDKASIDDAYESIDHQDVLNYARMVKPSAPEPIAFEIWNEIGRDLQK